MFACVAHVVRGGGCIVAACRCHCYQQLGFYQCSLSRSGDESEWFCSLGSHVITPGSEWGCDRAALCPRNVHKMNRAKENRITVEKQKTRLAQICDLHLVTGSCLNVIKRNAAQ